MSFASKADMVRHRREVHNFDEATGGPSPDHRCPVSVCKRHRRGFARLWNMQQHVRKMHGESVYAGLSAAERDYAPPVAADTPTSIDTEYCPSTPENVNIVDSSPLIRQHSAPGMMAQMEIDSPKLGEDKGEQMRKMQMRLNEQLRKRETLAEKRNRVDEEYRSVDDHIDTIRYCISQLARGG
ncbi:MAG: hypothetical protein MMC23_002709 [Stictis urceolatum]|nr:hypothetical protein [Stictis urceolata]